MTCENVRVRFQLDPDIKPRLLRLSDRSGLSTQRVVVAILELWLAEQPGVEARPLSAGAKKIRQIVEGRRPRRKPLNPDRVLRLQLERLELGPTVAQLVKVFLAPKEKPRAARPASSHPRPEGKPLGSPSYDIRLRPARTSPHGHTRRRAASRLLPPEESSGVRLASPSEEVQAFAANDQNVYSASVPSPPHKVGN